MPARNKDRLYLTLNHRYHQPGMIYLYYLATCLHIQHILGYHWSILLAPIDRPEDSVYKDSICWDITNEGLGPSNWKFRQRGVNQFASVSLIARILLGKFEVVQHDQTVQTLHNILMAQEIRNNDASFTCRAWVLNSLLSLVNQQIIQLQVQDMDGLEKRVRDFGDDVMGKIQRHEIDIAAGGVSAIPVLDLRKK